MRTTFVALSVLGMFELSGCGLMSIGHPVGVTSGGLFGDVTYATQLNPSTKHELQLTRNDIELKGTVSGTGSTLSILGIINTGDSGYGELLEAARAKGADGVMNVMIDTKVTNILLFLLVRTTTTLTGMAYKYK